MIRSFADVIVFLQNGDCSFVHGPSISALGKQLSMDSDQVAVRL